MSSISSLPNLLQLREIYPQSGNRELRSAIQSSIQTRVWENIFNNRFSTYEFNLGPWVSIKQHRQYIAIMKRVHVGQQYKVLVYDFAARKTIMDVLTTDSDDYTFKISLSDSGAGCIRNIQDIMREIKGIYLFSHGEIRKKIDIKSTFGMKIKFFNIVNDTYFAVGVKKSSPPIVFILDLEGSVIRQIEIPEFTDWNLCKPVFNKDFYVLVGLGKNSEGKLFAKAFVLDLQTGQRKIWTLEESNEGEDDILIGHGKVIHGNAFFYACQHLKRTPRVIINPKITELNLTTGKERKEYPITDCDVKSLVANDECIIYSRKDTNDGITIIHRRRQAHSFTIPYPIWGSSYQKLDFNFFDRYVHICTRHSSVIMLDLSEKKIVKQRTIPGWTRISLENYNLVIINFKNDKITVRDYLKPVFERDVFSSGSFDLRATPETDSESGSYSESETDSDSESGE